MALLGLPELLLVDARDAQQHVDLPRHVEQLAELRLVERRQLVPRLGGVGEPLEVAERELVAASPR